MDQELKRMKSNKEELSNCDLQPTVCHLLKIGGRLVEEQALLENICGQLQSMPGPWVIVHGGGKRAGEICRMMDIPEQMINGRRVTDERVLEVAVMTYAGWVNKRVVSTLQRYGINACGVSGCDMQVVKARKRARTDVDWGYVGDVESVATGVLEMFLNQGVVPVLSPITYGGDGMLLNTNADSVAAAVAESLAGKYTVELIYCFDKKGVLSDVEDEESVIPVLTREMYEKYKDDGIFYAGMLPKLANAFGSIANGVSSVRLTHPDELGIPGAGTVIMEK